MGKGKIGVRWQKLVSGKNEVCLLKVECLPLIRLGEVDWFNLLVKL